MSRTVIEGKLAGILSCKKISRGKPVHTGVLDSPQTITATEIQIESKPQSVSRRLTVYGRVPQRHNGKQVIFEQNYDELRDNYVLIRQQLYIPYEKPELAETIINQPITIRLGQPVK